MTRPQLADTDRPRLHAQLLRIQRFYLSHPGWWTHAEIARAIGAVSEAGVSMRLRELTYEPHRWVKQKRKRAGNLWEYRMTPPKTQPQLELSDA